MELIKEHLEYWRGNPKGFWFRRKLYGWGWFPVKWQGWFVIAIFILFILVSSLQLQSNPSPTDAGITGFMFKVFLSVIILILVCYKKGERPRWQWGIKNNEK